MRDGACVSRVKITSSEPYWSLTHTLYWPNRLLGCPDFVRRLETPRGTREVSSGRLSAAGTWVSQCLSADQSIRGLLHSAYSRCCPTRARPRLFGCHHTAAVFGIRSIGHVIAEQSDVAPVPTPTNRRLIWRSSPALAVRTLAVSIDQPGLSMCPAWRLLARVGSPSSWVRGSRALSRLVDLALIDGHSSCE